MEATLEDDKQSLLSELSSWDDHVERKWIPRIELVAGVTAMIVVALSLLWGGKSP